MLHTPDWHILDTSFIGGDDGLQPPTRSTELNDAKLRIENLDRRDPPGYEAGGVPRGDSFNQNLFRLTPTPGMPVIQVECSVAGFDPAVSPIHWRLVCRHVLGRYSNMGMYRYGSVCEALEREWRGQSQKSSFTLFGEDCLFTYNDSSRVIGGHALLEVAAQVNDAILVDYVHLRIVGSNPSVDDVCSYLQTALCALDSNIVYMLQAIFQQESNLTQFRSSTQSSAYMLFTQAYHAEPSQPDCLVLFNWPSDPSNFPLASFDFGVGISQFTEVSEQKVTADIAWDWRENVRQAANLFLGKLADSFIPGTTWMDWAMTAWADYNGSGVRAEQYALAVANTPEAALISRQAVDVMPKIAPIDGAPPLPPPGEWPVD